MIKVLYIDDECKHIYIDDEVEKDIKVKFDKDSGVTEYRYKNSIAYGVTEETSADELEYAIERYDALIWQMLKKYDISEEDLKEVSNAFKVLEELDYAVNTYIKKLKDC